MKNTQRYLLFTFLISALVFGLSLFPLKNDVKAFHSPEELEGLRAQAAHIASVTIDSSLYFPTATLCVGCHGYDFEGYAMVDNNGQDVNIADDWRSSMMANSAKDPFWRAKVSHEILINPAHSLELQDKCTTCHAPMGNYTAHYNGADHYTMDDLLLDTIGLDGVSCGACHQLSPENLGNTFSGVMIYDTSRVQYGPYTIPFAAPMSDFVGFEPVHSVHIGDAGLCASCHSLVTETVDLNGEFTGTTFVEQATYHEWLNSSYNTTDVSCQACHIPQIEDSVVISDNYLFLQGRTPYGIHELVGGNTMMLKLMKDNRQALGIDADEEHFDETIAATMKLLKENSLDMSLEMIDQTEDSLYFEIELYNKAGHKFPSGYPSRRAFIQFFVTTTEGDTIFQSGTLDEDFEVFGHDPHYEPHYQVITDESQVQIYEIVNGDVENNFTTILERADHALKDNRLAPLGFTTSHTVYDTTLIVGNALTDPDFNKIDGMEGTGTDIVRYHISREDYNGGFVNIEANVYYQSLAPRWLNPMLAEDTPEINAFRTMYEEADRSPVLIQHETIDSVYLPILVNTNQAITDVDIRCYPNPTADGWVNVELPQNASLQAIRIYDVRGALVRQADELRFKLPSVRGTYLVEVRTDLGTAIRRVVY